MCRLQLICNILINMHKHAARRPLSCSAVCQEQNSKRLEEISKLDTEAWELWNCWGPTEDLAALALRNL